jgi:hypothetical protein
LALEYLLQDVLEMFSRDPETDPEAVMDGFKRDFLKVMTVNRESRYEMTDERKEALRSRFSSSNETMKRWLPTGIRIAYPTFESWPDSWIWTLLSGDEHHLEQKSLGYFALSYVWMDHPPNPIFAERQYRHLENMVAASGIRTRQILEKKAFHPTSSITFLARRTAYLATRHRSFLMARWYWLERI